MQRQSVEATNFQRISDQKERDHFELPLTITLEILIEIKKLGGGDGALLMLTIQDRGCMSVDGNDHLHDPPKLQNKTKVTYKIIVNNG